jgi:hypothetical protein
MNTPPSNWSICLPNAGTQVALSHRADTGDVYAETRVAALLTLEDETLGPVR